MGRGGRIGNRRRAPATILAQEYGIWPTAMVFRLEEMGLKPLSGSVSVVHSLGGRSPGCAPQASILVEDASAITRSKCVAGAFGFRK